MALQTQKIIDLSAMPEEPSVDDTGKGISILATVDANATGIGAAMHCAADGHWEEADASADTTAPCSGLALTAGTGASKEILQQGQVRNDGWTWVTGPGEKGLIYLSITTGALTQTAPTGTGEIVQIVGHAITDDVMMFNPQLQYIELGAGPVAKSVFVAKGDVLSASAASTPLILTVGDNDKVLTAASGEATGLKWAVPVAAASTTVAGKVELAIASEVNTGTSAALAVTPDSLAGSYAGRKTVYLKVLAEDAAPTVTDGLMHFTVPSELNGMNLIDADAVVKTASSSGLPTFGIYNLTDASEMLSTDISINATKLSSYDAATTDPPVVDGTEDDVVTGDIIRIDCSIAGTDTLGLDIILVFGLP